MIKNVLLDWSGTLADDLAAVLRATNLIFAEYGRDPLDLEEFRAHFRLPFSEFYAELLPEATLEGLEPLYERFFRECFRKGIETCETGYVLETHTRMRATIENFGATIRKRYRLFEKSIGE